MARQRALWVGEEIEQRQRYTLRLWVSQRRGVKKRRGVGEWKGAGKVRVGGREMIRDTIQKGRG